MPGSDVTKNEAETIADPPLPPAPVIERSQISPIRRVRPGVLRRRPLANEKSAAPPVVVKVVVPESTAPPESLEKTAAIAEFHEVQQDLARERAQRLADAAEAEVKLAAVLRDLADTKTDVAAVRASVARERRTGLIGLVAVLLIGAFLIYRSVSGVTRVAAVRDFSATRPKAAAIDTSKLPVSLQVARDSPQAQFAHGLDRLNYTLEIAARDSPDETPEQAIRAVQAAHPALCPLLWKNGQVSLIFGGGQVTLASLTDMLTRCADAVARLP